MAGRDDDLIDLASDLAQDPELADTFAKLASAPDSAPPRSGSEFKNPLQGFIDRDRITPKLPPEPTSTRGSLMSQPSSRRTPSVRAFVAQPLPLAKAGSAQPASQRSPNSSGRAIAAPISFHAPPQPIVKAAPAAQAPSSIPGVARIYEDRDTPTTRFMKGSSPDSLPSPVSSDLEDLAAASEEAPQDEPRTSSPTLPGADSTKAKRAEAPSEASPAARSGRGDESPAPTLDPVAQLSSRDAAHDEGDGARRPRLWLLAAATLVAAGATLALLIAVRPLQVAKSAGSAAPTATVAPAARPAPAPKTADAAPPPEIAATTPAPAPAPTASAIPTVDAPLAAATTAPTIASAPAPSSSLRPGTAPAGQPTRTPPLGAATAPATKPTAKPTTKPNPTGPIFEMEN